MDFRPTQLTFMLTNGCNSRCRHCITNSGGRDSDELELSKLGEVIANIDVDIFIDLTGGEPFTEEKKIEAMVSAKGGSVNAINTNGFWGETERSAKSHLAWLYEDLGFAGMLILSTGEFHEEFVSLDSIRNILTGFSQIIGKSISKFVPNLGVDQSRADGGRADSVP